MAPSSCRNWLAIALAVAGLFFPLRETLGFNAREFTPKVVQKIVVLAAETRSFQRCVIAAREAEVKISAKTIQRLVHDVGGELAHRRDAAASRNEALAQRPEEPPELAVVECDGGRIRCRQPGHGPGVHLNDTGWREDKNACLIRATRQTFDDDPQPEPPECFCDPQHVAKIAETEALSVASVQPQTPSENGEEQDDPPAAPPDWRPRRLVRTVLSSLACAALFGAQMAREAKRRRFDEALAKAFLGDGLPWNWSIWNKRFRSYTPILDFIHPLSYLFAAAKAVHDEAQDAWDQYLAWMRGCWRGEVSQVLEELRFWQSKLGEPDATLADNDARQIIARTIGYLKNNQSRMRYPEYRRQGMPVTTAWMESLVKEIGYRAKGTEMFWNDPEGAEAILQIRAAALSDDDRLIRHLRTRPGSPFTRQPKLSKLPGETCKS